MPHGGTMISLFAIEMLSLLTVDINEYSSSNEAPVISSLEYIDNKPLYIT